MLTDNKRIIYYPDISG